MKIKFLQEHKSIKNFNEIDVANFSILTGLNGSGKTHILEGIKEGMLKVDNINKDNIIYFNFSNFLLQNQSPSNLQNISQSSNNIWKLFKPYKSKFEKIDKDIENIFEEEELKPNYFYNPEGMKKEDNIRKFGEYKKNIESIAPGITENISSGTSNNAQPLMIRKLFSSTPIPFSEIEISDLLNEEIFSYINYALIDNLSKIFLAYQRQIVLMGLDEKNGGYGLNEKKIKKAKEISPWKLINDIFVNFSLKHRVNEPNYKAANFMYPNLSFQVMLTVDGRSIQFADLSSGEKILVALAMTVFQDKKKIDFPELILLDEIDATLHPTMIKKTLSVIHHVFIKNGSKVIMATHSPTTIARVEQASIYEVKKGDEKDKIIKIDKQKALNILTDGFIVLDNALDILKSLSDKEIIVFTEGYNYKYIEKAIELLDPNLLDKVEVFKDISHMTGKNQLYILFDFFKIVAKEKKILFVWDCDCKNKVNNLCPGGNVIPFVFEENKNSIRSRESKGIENLFNANLFKDEYYDSETKPGDYGVKNIIGHFDKKKFCNDILINAVDKDFENFKPLIEKIKEILKNN